MPLTVFVLGYKKGLDIAKDIHVLRKTSFNRLRVTIIRGRLERSF